MRVGQIVFFLGVIAVAMLMPAFLKMVRKRRWPLVRRASAAAMFLGGMGVVGLMATVGGFAFGASLAAGTIAGIVMFGIYENNTQHLI